MVKVSKGNLIRALLRQRKLLQLSTVVFDLLTCCHSLYFRRKSSTPFIDTRAKLCDFVCATTRRDCFNNASHHSLYRPLLKANAPPEGS